MYWSISARSKHPAEAALFVDFLADSQEAADVLLTGRGVPANMKPPPSSPKRIKPLLSTWTLPKSGKPLE
ncbi:hypothetical protein ACIBO5_33400 [Nonomuraea angiospora]|uniref:hypothetical protein n=1 Tax=Nonomuraea angiospora TaxID=46172 RepID=UPI0029B1F0D7|nr:hypothetical protein [Nonomuraea angiospora]MDX3106771.1 hypothetical protein [Nonomuraea angiospora]